MRVSTPRVAVACLALLAIIPSKNPRSQERLLTFEERLRAQEAIERVYYSHQIGATKPFEEAVSRSALEDKVRDYLGESAALEEIWNTPVTAEALAKELDRIAGQTRLPGRLEQIYGALGYDAFLIQETFARASLVGRLTRSYFSMDERIHARAGQEAREIRESLVKGDLDPFSAHWRRSVTTLEKAEQGHAQRMVTDGSGEEAPDPSPVRLRLEPDLYSKVRDRAPVRAGEPGPVIEERDAFVVSVVLDEDGSKAEIATYIVPKTTWDSWWLGARSRFESRQVGAVADGGFENDRDALPEPGAGQTMPKLTGEPPDLSAHCAPDDTWDNGGLDDLPEPRWEHSVIWTGSVMIVWGGGSSRALLDTGSRYDPLTDTWSSLSVVNAPVARSGHTAVWSGTEMVVWGGQKALSPRDLSSGGRYNPVTDTWRPTSAVNAPVARYGHTAVWTGTRMIIWGGNATGVTNTGARYDPASDTWAPTATLNAPQARWLHSAVWTGTEMVVWGGGISNQQLRTGGRYNPALNSWTATTTVNAPPARQRHSALWTASRMIVWGGEVGLFAQETPIDTGGLYDPTADAWLPVSDANAPEARTRHAAVWTGSEMLVWGGLGSEGFLSSGGRYDPLGDEWSSMSELNAPSARAAPAVWTGSLMVVWGGNDTFEPVRRRPSSGGRYDPGSDSWTPTSMGGTAEWRSDHTGVWTGTLMIVWGGTGMSGNILNTGGRYDPLTDAWASVSTEGSPVARSLHTTVWTGKHMIVWGGFDLSAGMRTGGRYDPVTDTWLPTSTVNAPIGRWYHTAVWGGDRMIVWGGFNVDQGVLSSGGQYDPIADSWTPMNLTNAPVRRRDHTAVWTGRVMIVWGGFTGGPDNTGGRYDPTTDSWLATSTLGAPESRMQHSAVWSGAEMIVWGGWGNQYFQSGGRYDPAIDTWRPTSLVNAPSARFLHGAVWTEKNMIVWSGGQAGGPYPNTGGRYEPLSDQWISTSTLGAPSGRLAPTTLWTGSHMLVWGGLFGTGGRYAMGHSIDDDTDGYSECAGDCDDADIATYPGAAEMCDGLDNDCDGPIDEELESTTCGMGACVNTVDSCVGGVPQSCVPGTPTAEACDGVDNDCDGSIDENLGPGTIGVTLDPVNLWPPNHRMVDINATVTVSGGCPAACPTPPTVVLMSATCNEPDDANGVGDGQTVNDVQDASLGSADFDLKVRAERDGSRNGRLYEVIYAATDCFGDTAVGSGGVFVPHDEGGQTEPVFLEMIPREGGGAASYALQWSPVADATAYNVLGGRISTIRAVGSFTVIEESECVASGLTATSVSGGMFDENPAPGEAFFFLTEYVKGLPSGYGTESGGRELVIASGDSCH